MQSSEVGACLRFVRTGAVVAAIAGTAGCGIFTGPVACTDILVPGIAVDVRDSQSNAQITDGLRVIARDGAFADTAENGHLAVAFERAGTYTVTVEKDGYQTWLRSGVRVSRDECHVRTVALTAQLQR